MVPQPSRDVKRLNRKLKHSEGSTQLFAPSPRFVIADAESLNEIIREVLCAAAYHCTVSGGFVAGPVPHDEVVVTARPRAAAVPLQHLRRGLTVQLRQDVLSLAAVQPVWLKWRRRLVCRALRLHAYFPLRVWYGLVRQLLPSHVRALDTFDTPFPGDA
jgi:hypothetical protein